MIRKLKSVLLVGAIVGATTLVTTEVMSRQHDEDMAAMMEAWMKVAAPGPEHYEMVKLSGVWHQTNKHFMAPGMDPEVSESIATFRPILGGRFMVEEVKGTMTFGGQEMQFEAMGLFGYDRMKEKHFFAWVDNMGTMMMTGEGTEGEDGKITYYSELMNPMDGSPMKIKSIAHMDGDSSVFEMFEKTEDGWRRNMEITAHRH